MKGEADGGGWLAPVRGAAGSGADLEGSPEPPSGNWPDAWGGGQRPRKAPKETAHRERVENQGRRKEGLSCRIWCLGGTGGEGQ